MAKTLEAHPRLRREVLAASVFVGAINWQTTFGQPPDEGACIPVAVFTAAYLNAAGISARPVEAGARFDDPLSVRWAEIGTEGETVNALMAEDRRGLPFIGHMVVYVPTLLAVIDLSLPTQKDLITFTNLGGKVDVVVGVVNHHRGDVGFKVPYGRGEAMYRIYPKRDGWSKRRWPFADLRAAGERAYRGQGEFAAVDTHYEVEEL